MCRLLQKLSFPSQVGKQPKMTQPWVNPLETPVAVRHGVLVLCSSLHQEMCTEVFSANNKIEVPWVCEDVCSIQVSVGLYRGIISRHGKQPPRPPGRIPPVEGRPQMPTKCVQHTHKSSAFVSHRLVFGPEGHAESQFPFQIPIAAASNKNLLVFFEKIANRILSRCLQDPTEKNLLYRESKFQWRLMAHSGQP